VASGPSRRRLPASIQSAGRPRVYSPFERENIDEDELARLREISGAWLEADEKSLEHAIAEGILQEAT